MKSFKDPIKTKGRISNFSTPKITPRSYETHPDKPVSRNVGKGAKNDDMRAKM